MAIPRLKDYQGPALLSYGYRPFFFFGALYAGLSVLLWIPLFYGELSLMTAFTGVDWHVHEMFFGFLAAVVTGFLFTAIPNWTGRMPIQGMPLLLLVLLWMAGRAAVTFSGQIGWIAAMVIDLSFLGTILAVLANEIIVGKNWRNLKVLLPLSLLLLANVCFHLEVHFSGSSGYSYRLAMTAAISLIMLIGGRIIPSFTRNWLVQNNPGRLPAPISKFDMLTIAVTVSALILWIAIDLDLVSGVLLFIAAGLQFIRVIRWGGERSIREPLVLILHLSYFFIPLGLALLGIAGVFPDYFSSLAGIHALGTGAIGCMTLSVMLRAALGHSGQKLRSGFRANTIFLLILLSASTRIVAEFMGDYYGPLLQLAALSWFLAFAGFSIGYSPLFFKPRA